MQTMMIDPRTVSGRTGLGGEVINSMTSMNVIDDMITACLLLYDFERRTSQIRFSHRWMI